MSTCGIVLDLPSLRDSEFLAHYSPWNRFQIPSFAEGGDYIKGIFEDLMPRFSGVVFSSFNRGHVYLNRPFKGYECGRQCGIEIWCDEWDLLSKLYVYGQTRFPLWKGVQFSDHYYLHEDRKVMENIFQLADLFEQFLRKSEIPYERFVMPVSRESEILLSKFPDA